ncbi:hypothetical protein ACF0H5_013921 [Mactra antiquata]
MTSAVSQFLLMLWKNYKLQSRRKVLTVFEIIIPLLFAILLLLFRILSSDYSHNETSTYEARIMYKVDTSIHILYTPENEFTTRIVNSTGAKTQGFGSEEELLRFYVNNATNEGYNSPTYAAVVFMSHPSSDRPTYKIRFPSKRYYSWDTGSMYKLFGDRGPRYDGPDYSYSGFLYLQHAINKAITMEYNKDAFKDVTFYVQKMLYPPYTKSSILSILQFTLSLFVILSFILNVPQMAKYITYEKEVKLRESMKMMGLRTSVYWLSWFVKNLIYLIVVIIIYSIICFINTGNGRLFESTEPFLFFLLFLFYVIATIAFSFMISTFFKKANSAAFAAGILFFLTYVPTFFLNSRYERMSRGEKMGTCLLHNMAMSFGVNTILIAEKAGEGYRFKNVNQPGQLDDNLSLLDTMIMLLVDAILYMLIAWYVDTVNPGDIGVPQPLWFPFKPSYWCGSKVVDKGYETMEETENGKYFETDRSGAKTGISVQHLRKRFGSNVAVKDMTLTMYEGQITALLGHNGAGKTTTISMLIGFLKPSGGTAYINGKDISVDMDEIRQDIGLCPQHNILFDTLTVEEHLRFFAKLKGCDRNVMQEVNDMITCLGLEQKRHALSSTLSGGQKRKLSVGIALIGGSKIVILDEPTSGMDPAARRHMWDILQRYRSGRTIILTTHFMDEADILGDRIAIMSNGELQCCGTSMFLKNCFGAGYHLIVVKGTDCDIEGLTKLIQRFIPAAIVESHVSSEISFLLPFNESEKFEELFNEIEANMTQLGIRSFGTSATTMEEVFLRVGEGAAKDDKDGQDQSVDGYVNPDVHTADESPGIQDPDTIVMVDLTTTNYIGFNQNIRKNAGIELILQQCLAIFIKKFIHTRRNLAITIAQLILPVFFAILALSIIKSAQALESYSPPLTLDLNWFPRYTVPYAVPENDTSYMKQLGVSYGKQFGANSVNIENQGFTTMNGYVSYKINEIGLPKFDKEVIIGGEFVETASQKSITAHYNQIPYHSVAISLQYAMNGLLKYVTNDDSKHITAINHPLPALEEKGGDSAFGIDMSVAILVVFGMAFMSATFSMFYIKERSIGSKHLQVVSGTGPITYWIASFAWDMVNYILPVFVILIVFAAFQVSLYVDRLGYVFFVFVLFGWSVLPYVYLFQLMFSKPATGLILISLINIFTGLIFLIVIQVMQAMENAKDAGDGLDYIFCFIFPNYNLGRCIINIFVLGIGCDYNYCDRGKDCCIDVLSMENPGIGRECLVMFIQGVVYMILVLVIELGLIRRLFMAGVQKASQKFMQPYGQVSTDSDVTSESERINATPVQDLKKTDSIILKNVSKVYGSGFQAVKNVSCGIQANECFGLLGQNGAGKSTTFKMLTGEEIITSGEAYLKNLSLLSDIKQVHRNIGYCPQFDALIDQMTGRETLYMYARLRGITQSDIKSTVNKLVEVLMLGEHIDKQTSQYSGGNKRKLSTAISLIGDSPFIFLDEPTTGLDPAARRQLWNVIADVRASGRTIILISHSMEECDALCTKLVIMVNGNFVCLGSPQHLKNKFGHGYTLFCRMGIDSSGNTASSEPLLQFIKSTFTGATKFDDNTGYIHFTIPDDNAKLGQIFGIMEASKKQYNVEDYSVHQTSLEQIFLSFVKDQIPPAEQKQPCCARCGCICFTMCC